jgi:hypothetical protein
MLKAWKLVTWTLALVGVLAAVTSRPTSAVLTTAFLGAVAGYCIRMGFYAGVPEGTSDLVRIIRSALRDAIHGAVALTALIGLATWGIPVVLGAVVIVGGGGGWLWYGSRSGPAHRDHGTVVFGPSREHERVSATGGPAEHPLHTPAPRSAEQLSAAELAAVWQRSFAALGPNTDLATTLAVVDVRQACLDELERRDPGALQRWLARDPRATEDPTRYFKRTV